jgi:hypothetical protein
VGLGQDPSQVVLIDDQRLVKEFPAKNSLATSSWKAASPG